MIDIKRDLTDRRRLILQLGSKYWNISYKEARELLKKLKQLKIGQRKK